MKKPPKNHRSVEVAGTGLQSFEDIDIIKLNPSLQNDLSDAVQTLHQLVASTSPPIFPMILHQIWVDCWSNLHLLDSLFDAHFRHPFRHFQTFFKLRLMIKGITFFWNSSQEDDRGLILMDFDVQNEKGLLLTLMHLWLNVIALLT